MMKEEEEIIIEGNPLYDYMQEVGVPQLNEISVPKQSGKQQLAEMMPPIGSIGCIDVSEHVWRILKVIFDSNLLFNDDHTFASSCIPEMTVQTTKNRISRGLMVLTLGAAVDIGAIILDKCGTPGLLQNVSTITACFSFAAVSGYLGKLIYDVRKEQRMEKTVVKHIRSLQKFYKLIQKVICDVRDIDMITRNAELRRNQLPEGDDQKLVPLAKFRLAIMSSVFEVTKSMTSGFIILADQVPERVKQADFITNSTTSDLITKNMIFRITQLSANDLNKMNHIYQLVQSEYLRWLALCFSPMKPKNDIFANSVCIEVINSVHSVVLKCYWELNFQYVINFCRRKTDLNCVEKPRTSFNNPINVLADGLHGVMNFLVSLMEETRWMETSLNLSSHRVEQGLESIEDSMNMFGQKFNQFKLMVHLANNNILKLDTDLKKVISTINSACPVENNCLKHTKDHLSQTSAGASAVELSGKSDFSIQGEHEVFIGTSFNNTNTEADTGEEYIFERRQLMPNVLSELKTALKPVYEMHAERERQALIRTGRSYLETVVEEDISFNTDSSTGIKDSCGINSPKPANNEVSCGLLSTLCSSIVVPYGTTLPLETNNGKCETTNGTVPSTSSSDTCQKLANEGSSGLLNTPCSSIVVPYSTPLPLETNNGKCETTNGNNTSSTGCPMENVTYLSSCTHQASDEIKPNTEIAEDSVNSSYNNAANNIPAEVVPSTSSSDKLTVSDSPSDIYIDIYVTEPATLPAADSKAIVSTGSCQSSTGTVEDSSENTSCSQQSQNTDGSQIAPSLPENSSPLNRGGAVSCNADITSSSQSMLKNKSSIEERDGVRETVLSKIGNIKLPTKRVTFVEEEYVYDGDVETDISSE